MKQGIDTLNNYKQWNELYNGLAARDKSPFFTPQYYQAYLEVENQPVQCFWVYQDEDNCLFYPFLIRSVNALGYELDDEYYDLCGAYGYNGPLGKVKDPNFISSFNNELKLYLHENKVVTEFVRYCPLVGNRKYHNYTEQINVLENVYVDLSKGPDYVWEEEFGYRVRTAVRKGASYNLETVFLSGEQIDADAIREFFAIYNSTMQRNEADDYYYFDLAFFTKLVEVMKDKVLLSTTYLGDKAISTELLLIDEQLCFGFLGGTLADYYEYKANTFQRWELIKHIGSLGIQKYSMGGGVRGSGLHKFKLSFAKNCDNPFYIGTKVHNSDVYSEILAQWRSKYPEAAERYRGKIQGYRNLL
ncbi:MAG: GNAT family N-acetyltransferase [Candidatus Cloacimonadaceae bacterium]|jgi:serine/alanine adding enzyme